MKDVIVNERASLTGLRGVAVAIVVASHLGNVGMDVVPGLRLNAIGKAGVWLFFALSAFLLTSHLAALLSDSARSRATEIGRYAVNRFFRIFPLYAVVLAAHWAWGDFDAASVVRHLLLIEGRDELWAIPVEFQYYVAIPFVAMLIALRGARVAAVVLAAVLGASVAMSFVSPAKIFSNDLDLIYRLPAFIAGSLAVLSLAWVARTRAVSSGGFAVAVAIAAVLAAYAYRAVVLDERLVGYAPLVALLLAAVWAASLLGAYREDAPLARLLSARPLVFLGKVSFGVYLWHLFAVRVAMAHATLPGWVLAWLAITAAVAVAALTYFVVERPGILLGRRLGRAITSTSTRAR